MHRNAEIWEKRDARLSEIARRVSENCRHAALSASTLAERDVLRQRREAWSARFNPVAKRVWHALCVAKEWRKA